MEVLLVSPQMVEEYWSWFVNRRDFLVQRPEQAANGKWVYSPPKDGRNNRLPLTLNDVKLHLAGQQTICLYPIEPLQSTCKWIVIEADYDKAFDEALSDLAVVKQTLKECGLEGLLEKSSRGGRLWIFAAEPLPADLCWNFAYNFVSETGVPVKYSDDENGGLDIIPRRVIPRHVRDEANSLGSAILGPLGVQRKDLSRCWFDSAPWSLPAQFDLIRSARRLTLSRLETLAEPYRYAPPPDFADDEECS